MQSKIKRTAEAANKFMIFVVLFYITDEIKTSTSNVQQFYALDQRIPIVGFCNKKDTNWSSVQKLASGSYTNRI